MCIYIYTSCIDFVYMYVRIYIYTYMSNWSTALNPPILNF